MAGTITFRVGEIRKLYEHSRSATTHFPSYDHLFDPKCHKGGVVRTSDGREYKNDSNPPMWPDEKNVDHKLVPACLVLVGDHGLYLMSNGEPALLDIDENRRSVVYARECDPSTMEVDDWWESKNRIFGGDDETIPLELSMFDDAMALPDDTKLKIKLTKTKVFVEVPVKRTKLAIGMKVRFFEPVTFTSGFAATLFRIDDVRKGLVTAIDDNGKDLKKCKIQSLATAVAVGAEIVA